MRPQIAGPAKHRGFTPEGAGRAVAYGKLSLPASGPANSIVVGPVTVTAVPESSTISRAGFALVATGYAARRRIRRSA